MSPIDAVKGQDKEHQEKQSDRNKDSENEAELAKDDSKIPEYEDEEKRAKELMEAYELMQLDTYLPKTERVMWLKNFSCLDDIKDTEESSSKRGRADDSKRDEQQQHDARQDKNGEEKTVHKHTTEEKARDREALVGEKDNLVDEEQEEEGEIELKQTEEYLYGEEGPVDSMKVWGRLFMSLKSPTSHQETKTKKFIKSD